jgi:hypothetical protein
LRFVILFIVINIFSSLVYADDIQELMLNRGYVEKIISEVESWNTANRAQSTFVKLDNSLVITQDEELERSVYFDTGTVKYIGIDHGEWGGGLYLDNYSKNKEPLFSANIRALVPINNDLYIVSGLAHMGSRRGAIHVIRNYNIPTKPIQVTLLPDAPQSIALGKSRRGSKAIVIAGYSSLMEFVPDSDLKIMVFDAFWSSLYPSSIVQIESNYFIGIRSGVAVINIENRYSTKVRYFVPQET